MKTIRPKANQRIGDGAIKVNNPYSLAYLELVSGDFNYLDEKAGL